MRIIRCLWNTPEVGEIEKYTLRNTGFNLLPEDQTVYCWGIENEKVATKLGYKTVQMGLNEYGAEGFFINKLLALDHASRLDKELLFLDWDCVLHRNLDVNFWTSLSIGAPTRVPLYYFPKDAVERFAQIDPRVQEYGIEKTHFFNLLMYQVIRYCKWEYLGGLCVPNAGFIYTRDPALPSTLLSIQKKHTVVANIEEICLMIYFNEFVEDLDNYIREVEPETCIGKTDVDMWGSQHILNSYINSINKKNTYFVHE